MTWPVQHITQSIDAPMAAVSAVAGDPRRLPEWAAGLSSGIRDQHGRWFTDSPMGAVEVAFVGPVEHGILDHDVTLPDGTVFHNPLRVLANGDGSEVVFSLFRLPGVSDADYAADAETIRGDLLRLKGLLEG